MKFLHTMIRVNDLDKSLFFFCELLGLKVVKKNDYPEGKFTLVYLSDGKTEAEIELTHNWENTEDYSSGRNFGHLAFEVDDIYATCEKLQKNGITILRPPRDGYMAFVKTPDNISIEFLQKGAKLAPQEPWASMQNTGSW